MATLKVYAIPNCNTVKKALDWLNANKVKYEFHDYKKQGITATILSNWSKQVGWESLINKKGATWRQLPQEIQATITSQKAAIELMVEKTSMIKRPLITLNDKVILLGFDETEYKKHCF
ncbi:MAG: ArsC family reductase [Sediminibacterium sp.]|jgi:arsenate reductase